jgi:peptide deformylase
MAVKNIIRIGNPILRQISEKVEKIDKEILSLIKDMSDTIKLEEYNAVGLAAVQVGVPKRIIVINWGKVEAFINPEIEIIDKEEEEQNEGCLSLYSIGCMVKRPKRIKVNAITPKAAKVSFEAEGMLARIFLHETDHLNGRLFIDYLDTEAKRELMIKVSEKS